MNSGDVFGTAWSWLAGWSIFLLILSSFARTEWGKPIVYYMLWLMIALLLITNVNQINQFFFNAGITSGLGNPGGGTGMPNSSGDPPKYPTAQDHMQAMTT